MQFSGDIDNSARNRWLNVDGDPDHYLDQEIL